MKVGAAMPKVELNVAAPRVEVEAEGGLMGKLFVVASTSITARRKWA